MKKIKQFLYKISAPKEIPDSKPVSKKTSAIVLSIISILSIVIAVVSFIYLKTEMSDPTAFKKFVEDNYIAGVFILIFLSGLQVIIAVMSGELIEIAAGFAFGTVPGAIYCLIGSVIGSVIAIILTRKFGRRFVEAFYPKEKIDALPVIRDTKKRNFIVFIIFLMSGTPKDMTTYVIGLTNMSISLYLLLTTIARFPAIIISTYIGSNLLENNFKTAFITFLIMAAVSLLCIFVYSLFQRSSIHKYKESQKNEKNSEK